MQTNKISGFNTISLVNSQHPTLPLVGLNSGGSVNQKAEAAAAQFGYYGLISPDSHHYSLALAKCIYQLKDELAHGHMLGELLTDSHSPIHLRARTSLMLYLLRTKPSLGILLDLRNLVVDWFEHHVALLSLGVVPSGPLQGCILLPCARKRGATHEDLSRDVHNPMLYSDGGVVDQDWQVPRSILWPGDPVREGFLAMVAGVSTPLPHRQPGVHPRSTHLGKGAQVLSDKSPDTAAIPITKLVLAKGGFGPNVLRGSLPKLAASNFKVTFYADSNGHPAGHWARFGDTQEQRSAAHTTLGVDSVTSLWVEYGSGKFSFLDPIETPHPFTGNNGKVIGEVSWDENGYPKS